MGASAFSSLELTMLPIFLKPLCIIDRMSLSLELSLGSSEARGIGIGTMLSLVSVGEFSGCGLRGSLASSSIGSVSSIAEPLGEGQQLVLREAFLHDHEVLMGSRRGFFSVCLARMASCSRSALHCIRWALRSTLKVVILISDFECASARILSVCSQMALRSLAWKVSTCLRVAS